MTVQAENSFDRTLTVATDYDYWPYVYYGQDGRLTGHDIELITLVANELGYNLELLPRTWEEFLEAVRTHEADAVHTVEEHGLEELCDFYESNKAAFEALADDRCDCVVVRYIIGLGIFDEMGARARGIDGYEAAKAIRKLPDPHASGIPIIAMTANAFEEDKQNAFASGMNGHVAKPIDLAKLKAEITKFV